MSQRKWGETYQALQEIVSIISILGFERELDRSLVMQVYREHRIAHIQALKAAGESPYPHKFHVDLSLTDYIEKYSHLEDGARLEDTLVNISGECIPTVGCLYIVVARASFLLGLHFY